MLILSVVDKAFTNRKALWYRVCTGSKALWIEECMQMDEGSKEEVQ